MTCASLSRFFACSRSIPETGPERDITSLIEIFFLRRNVGPNAPKRYRLRFDVEYDGIGRRTRGARTNLWKQTRKVAATVPRLHDVLAKRKPSKTTRRESFAFRTSSSCLVRKAWRGLTLFYPEETLFSLWLKHLHSIGTSTKRPQGSTKSLLE